MTATYEDSTRWTYTARETGHTFRDVRLSLYWEASSDPISDNFTPADRTAHELLREWAHYIRGMSQERTDPDLVPIYWFIQGDGPGTANFEAAPYQPLDELMTTDDWNHSYKNTVTEDTSEPLNVLRLPVRDKLWRPGRGDKGGFIQEATGWKPAALQPYVYLPALLHAAATGE